MPASAYPEGLLADIRARLGSWPVSYEAYGGAPVQELLALRDEMIANTSRSTELALWLLQRDWRFALICFQPCIAEGIDCSTARASRARLPRMRVARSTRRCGTYTSRRTAPWAVWWPPTPTPI